MKKERVELNIHTKMSTMDGVASIGEYIKQAAVWEHAAVAVTDHGCVQCISRYGIYCNYFKNAVLPADRELFAEIMQPSQQIRSTSQLPKQLTA